jgi:predicted dehydrogenase
MAKLRTAVIGAGKMGKIHAKVYSKLDSAELVAIADSNAERAGALAEQFGCRAVSEPAALIGQVDAVTISTPTVAILRRQNSLLKTAFPC